MPFRFLAVVVTGLALIAPGAHLYELSNKLALSKSDYFVVQGIYQWLVARRPAAASCLSGKSRPGLHLATGHRRTYAGFRGRRFHPCQFDHFLFLHTARKRGDRQLDLATGKLGGAPPSMGILACGERRCNLPGVLLGYCVRHTEVTPPTRSAPNSRTPSSRPF